MTEITVGCALREHSVKREPVLFGRVVHVDTHQDLVVIVKFPGKDKHGHQKNYVPRPIFGSLLAWSAKVAAGDLSVARFEVPAHWLLTSDQLRSNADTGLIRQSRRDLKSWLRRRSEAYRLIRPFVHGRSIEEIVLDPTFIGWPSRRADELKLNGCARIQRTLNAYLLALGNRNGLLPWYTNCGAPGVQKLSKVKTGKPIDERHLSQGRDVGANCDLYARVHFSLGWKKFKLPRVSVRIAFEKTLAEWFAESVEWNGTQAKVKLRPDALKYTVRQFEYWGMRDPESLSALDINRGETLARRTYLRRQGKVKDRHRTVNGEAFLDSTSCDQTLVSSSSRLKVLSSPWRTDLMGAATDYIFGHYVGFESPSQSTALMAILHAAEDKVEYCARYGIKIQQRDWLSMTFRQIVMDNGEGKGALVMRTLEEMESGASFGPAYDAINKSPQESKHASTQRHVDHLLPGSTMGARARRGEPSRASLARLNFFEYMPRLIEHVLFHNNKEIITLPSLEMRREGVEPTRRGVVEWMTANGYVTSAPIDLHALKIRCLPRVHACIQPDGIHLYDPTFNGKRLIPQLVYSNDWLRQSGALSNGRRWKLEAHINPSYPAEIWVNLDGLKCMSLQSADPDLHQVTLLDWLTICNDDRISAFLGKAIQVQEGVNAAVARNVSVHSANKERKAQIKAMGKKPTKSVLKKDKRNNTALERSAMTGMPHVPKPPQPSPHEDHRPNTVVPTTSVTPVHIGEDIMQAIRSARTS